ncbi:MAG: hypothetical protein AAF694_06345 [Bacteroidota bacterium]
MANTEDRILTLHPQGKQGVNILTRRYELVKETLISLLQEHGEISYKEMNEMAEERLKGALDGSIPWYVVSVKLDLEARGIVSRIPKTSPHRLRLVGR